jgi:peptidoglycan L-alanyl-D-glutamate endopeptidase CwlK
MSWSFGKKLLVGSIVTGGIILIAKRKKVAEFVNTKVWDFVSEQRINQLHPKIRDKVREFINKADKAGIQLRITSGLRSWDEQQKLYNQGRTEPGAIVTNAKPGESYHNFGLAFDVVPIVNGQADFNTPYWNKIAQIGKSVGFIWGGDFKSIKDKPHFEMNFGGTLAQFRNLYTSGKTTEGYINIV